MTREAKQQKGAELCEYIVDLLCGYQKRCKVRVLAIRLQDRRVFLTCEDKETAKPRGRKTAR